MKKVIALFILALLIASPVASDIEAVLNNGVGARAISMGKAQVANPKGTDGIYWNPAGLAKENEVKISTGAAEILGTNYQALAVIAPAVGGQLGLMVLNASQGNIPEATLDVVNKRPVATGSIFAYNANAWFLSYAFQVGKILAGVTGKYLKESLFDRGSSGVGMDLGLMAHPSENLALGVKLENVIKPQMKWDTTSGSVDRSSFGVRVGASLNPKRSNLCFNGDLNIKEDRSLDFFFGGEYRLVEALALRGGIFNGFPTLGLGLDYRGVSVDYSYTKGNEYLEDSHRVNLSFALGQPSLFSAKVKPQEVSREVLAKEEEKLPIPVTLLPVESKSNPLEKKILFSAFGSALPGRTLYFKVITQGIKAERVSVLYGNDKITLYSSDRVTWKGDFTLKPTAHVGKQYLDIYVADVDGHLYKQRAAFEVKPLPEINIIRADYGPIITTLEVALPEEVERVSLVVEDKKYPLKVEQGRAVVQVASSSFRQKKTLYLADREGRLFICQLNFDGQRQAKEEPASLASSQQSWPFAAFLIFGLVGIIGLGTAYSLWKTNGKKEEIEEDSEIII